MSNTITAYFKGRVGVAESVYQNDYGMVMNFDSIDLPAHFDCYFSILNQEEAIPGVGADGMVAIPNSVLANPGTVTIHIPLHTGSNDSEVEYIVYFKVIGRARPIDDGTPVQMTAIEQALALLQNPITNIEQIVNEALAFTGETFEEMQEDLDEWKTDTEEGLETWKGGVESDFDNLDAQFQTAVSAVTTDTEVTNIRVGEDGITYTTAGEAVRNQFGNIKKSNTELYDALGVDNLLPITIQNGYFDTPSNTYKLVGGNWRVGTIDVTDAVRVKIDCYGGAIAHGWNFRDANDNLISHSTEAADTQVTGLELFVPPNASTLILNASQHGETTISCKAINIIEAIDEFQRVIDNTVSFSDYNGADIQGLYPILTKDYYLNANGRAMIISNFGVLALKINCVAPQGCAAVMFYNDVPEASTFIGSYGDTTQQTSHTDELVIVPSNAKYIVVNNLRTVKALMSVQVGTNKKVEAGTAYDYTIQTGGGYNDIVKGWYAGANYKGTLIDCEEGDIFVVSTVTNGHNPLAIAFSGTPSEDTYLFTYDRYNFIESVYENVVIVAPKGCTKMAINGYLSNELIISHESVQTASSDKDNASGFPVTISNDVLTVKPNRADNGDLITVVMKKRGGNNLFEFDSISAMSDAGVSSVIETNVTDWFMPYKIRAVSNIDGDNPGSYYFTGGNHRSTNQATGGVVTGVCDSLKFFADGVETTDFSGICNEVRVEWQNKVQAFNTTKEDGTGRMVMQCNHYLTIRDGEFKCRTILTPLEDVELLQYYGYAMHCTGNDCYVRYIGSHVNRHKTAIGTESNSGDKKTKTISIEKGAYHMDLTLDKILDLGSGENASNVENDAFTAYNKTYWWVVNTTVPMSNGDSYYVDAMYRFH